MEAKTRNVLRLIQSACSRRVVAVPTTQVAARRCAGLPLELPMSLPSLCNLLVCPAVKHPTLNLILCLQLVF